MLNKLALESAIMEAQGAAAVLVILEDHLTANINEGWKTLQLPPRSDLRVTALSRVEDRALRHASQSLVEAVKCVAAVFYGPGHDPQDF